MKTPIESLFELLCGSLWSGAGEGKDCPTPTEVHPSMDPDG